MTLTDTAPDADAAGAAAQRAAVAFGRALLFSPLTLRGCSFANRVVMAPMTRRKAAEDGIPTPEMAAYYGRRAAGGVGLIVSEGVAIDETHSFDTPTVPRMVTEAQIEGWRRVVESVHAEGGAFAPQLWHTGRLAQDPIGPADEPPREHRGRTRPAVRAMIASDFEQVLAAYRHAAAASVAIGCDAVEIHGAHGYLLDSFLDARFNTRDDEWGGDPVRRMAFPLAVTRAVREVIGPAMPLIYRFSQWQVEDYEALKWRSPDDLAPWVEALRAAGVDVLHVSTRNATDVAFPRGGESALRAELTGHESTGASDGNADTVPPDSDDVAAAKTAPLTLAGWSRRLSGLPTIAVGGVGLRREGDGPDAPLVVDDPGPAIALLARGEADMLAVGRMLIANPSWAHVVRDGDWRELKAYDHGLLATLD